MPFRTDQLAGAYKPAELKALQRTYLETCVLLNVSSPTEAEAMKIAKQVYRIYDSGIEDPHEIARIIRHADSID